MLQQTDHRNGGDREISLWRVDRVCTWLIVWVNQNFLVAGMELRDPRRELSSSKQAAFATGTTRNLLIWWRSCLIFWLYCLYCLILYQRQSSVCLIVQFLSWTFKAVSSIQNCISGLCNLHALLELSFAAAGSIELSTETCGLDDVFPPNDIGSRPEALC